MGRGSWRTGYGALPAAFVGAMVAGYAAAVAAVPLPLVEPMILVSVFALGLAVALALRLPLAAAAGVVALFGLFHGHAHGGEVGTAGALTFGAGFALSTALLHGLGMMAGRAVAGSRLLRGLGWATAAGGVWAVLGG